MNVKLKVLKGLNSLLLSVNIDVFLYSCGCVLFGVLHLRLCLERTLDCKTVDPKVPECYCQQGVSGIC